jgi:signal transduction histidine kinase/PAS domain-containing protein
MGIHQPDGRLVWLSINAQPVFEADGKTLVGAVSSFFDITERKAAAEALRESEGRLSQLLRASVAGTWEVNPLTGKGTADAPLRALHAFPPDGEFDVETALATIHPEDQERIRDAVSAALAGHDAGRYFSEYRVMRPEGGIRWVEARGQASLDAAGKAVRFLGTCLDITRRKAAEFAREGLLEALAAQPSLLVCVVRGPRFILQLAPPLYLQRVARGRDIRGQPLLEAVPELKSQGFEELLTRVLETGVPFVGREISARFDQGDGTLEEGFFDVVYQPVRGEGGTYDSMLLISHEVTSVVHSRRRAERLAAEEKTRADFEQQLIGIVSHDLRNPLGAILLGTKALARREELDERSTKAVMRIQASAERAVRLVKDLLDFTQARLGGGLPIARAPMDLHALVSQVAEEVQANFPERELRVETQGQGQGEWDLDRVAQVVTNLTSNALKYGRPGTPVTVRTRGDGDWVALEVHNQGTPIPPEAREHLFEPLQRATAQADTVGRSVGLGLYIVKHIVDAHGGGIDVTSTETEGTTFTVRLPRHARPPV